MKEIGLNENEATEIKLGSATLKLKVNLKDEQAVLLTVEKI